MKPIGYVSVTARMLAARRQSARMREHRQRAYHERNLLVAVLTRIWPAHLMPLRPGTEFQSWNWVVCIHSPEGLLNWHLPNEEVEVYFSHLEKLHENHWDKHTQDLKWERLEKLVSALNPSPSLPSKVVTLAPRNSRRNGAAKLPDSPS